MTYDEMRRCLRKLKIRTPETPGPRNKVLRYNELQIGGTYANAKGDEITDCGYLTLNTGPRFPKNHDYCQQAQSHSGLWKVVWNYNTRKDGIGKKTKTPRCHLIPLGCEALKDFLDYVRASRLCNQNA